MSSINNPPRREKMWLLKTVKFILGETFTSPWWGTNLVQESKLYASLFRVSYEELESWESIFTQPRRDPTSYKNNRQKAIDDMSKTIPEPILSHSLATVAISCMQYLCYQHPNTTQTQEHLFAWAMKSKCSPWLWRQRMRVTSTGRHNSKYWSHYEHTYSFPQCLRQSRRILYSKVIQSDAVCQERHIFYMWTLKLLYRTLRKAMKSDVLIKALSKPFISSAAHIFFPHRIKQVKEAVDEYLEKVSWIACLNLRIAADIFLCQQFSPPSLGALRAKRGVHSSTQLLPQNVVIPFNGDDSESFKMVSEV